VVPYGRDVLRSRIPGLVVVVVAVAALAFAAGTADTPAGRSAEPAAGDAAVLAAPKVLPRLVAPRLTVDVVPAGWGGFTQLSLVAFFSVAAGLVGRRLRRVGDVGDDWRSLLEGAPPAHC
jgi:hypothetical protein